MTFKIKENSFVARIAAWKLKSKRVAIVFGSTIHLHNTSKEDFLSNERWVKHELEHIRQYHQYGFVSFIARYLIESIRKGYHNNRFEVAAREAERELGVGSQQSGARSPRN
jgi:hypothetical protein